MRTQGRARRSRLIWSPRRVSSFSRASRALRSASHCCRETMGWCTSAMAVVPKGLARSGAELEGVFGDGGEALPGADEDHPLGDLGAELQAEAPRAHGVEGGRAPVLRRLASHQGAAPAGGAHEEAALHQL